MAKIQVKNSPDFNVYFNPEHTAGVLVQPRLNDAIYFANGKTIEHKYFQRTTKLSEIDEWIEAKRLDYLSKVNK